MIQFMLGETHCNYWENFSLGMTRPHSHEYEGEVSDEVCLWKPGMNVGTKWRSNK